MGTLTTVKASTHPALAAVAGGAVLAMLRRRYLQWGATASERRSPLAGDDLIPAADLVVTRAISI